MFIPHCIHAIYDFNFIFIGGFQILAAVMSDGVDDQLELMVFHLQRGKIMNKDANYWKPLEEFISVMTEVWIKSDQVWIKINKSVDY